MSRGFHDSAVQVSRGLLSRRFESSELDFVDLGPGNNPDIGVYKNSAVCGHAEVKTIVDRDLTEMLSLLFGKGFFREDRKANTGRFHLTLQKTAQIKKIKDMFWKRLNPLDEHALLQPDILKTELSKLGVTHVQHFKDEDTLSLILHPPTITFGPSEGQISSGDLLLRVISQFDKKGSFEAMKNGGKLHNHIFAWPDDTLYPGLAFASEDDPYKSPSDEPELPKWLSGFWIGHTYSLNKPNHRAWFYSRENGWEVVESRAA